MCVCGTAIRATVGGRDVNSGLVTWTHVRKESRFGRPVTQHDQY